MILPSQVTYVGGYNITVAYEGNTYNFSGDIPPIGANCLTYMFLRVTCPSTPPRCQRSMGVAIIVLSDRSQCFALKCVT